MQAPGFVHYRDKDADKKFFLGEGANKHRASIKD